MIRSLAHAVIGFHAAFTASVAWFLAGPASEIDAHEAAVFYIMVALYWITLVLACDFALNKRS